MAEQIINISFPVKEGILTTLKETKDEFTQDVIFFISPTLLSKKKLDRGNINDYC